MRKWIFGAAAVVLAAVVSQMPLSGAQTADVKADYDRANSLGQRVRANMVYNVAEAPVWIDGSQKFWYRKSVKGGNEFVLVDATAATKAAAFDHARLATALSAAANGNYTAITLPFTTFTFVDNMQAIQFTMGAGGGGGGRAGGGGGGGGGR